MGGMRGEYVRGGGDMVQLCMSSPSVPCRGEEEPGGCSGDELPIRALWSSNNLRPACDDNVAGAHMATAGDGETFIYSLRLNDAFGVRGSVAALFRVVEP